ncbi:hypothetical protein VTK56DRAFT_4637 [Thermocarpiscus australiensis]
MASPLEDEFSSPGAHPNRITSPATARASISPDHARPPLWTAPSHPPRPPPSSLSSSSHRLSSSIRRSIRTPYSSSSSTSPPDRPQSSSLLTTLLATLTTLANHALRLYLSLSRAHRILLLAACALAAALAVLALVYSHRVFAALGPLAATWRASPAGWLLVWLAAFATAFPPVVGYSTCMTIAGYLYGFPGGWPLAASATVAGSTAAFLAGRGMLAGYVQRLVGGDRRFVALGQVLRRDGLGVLVMIRLCPLPYSLSNGFLATVGSIRAGRFALATACATPKLLVHIFIGSRLALLAESGDKMSGADRAVNYASMAIGALLGFGVGLLIYRRTMARAAELAREAELEAGEALLDGRPSEEEEDMDGGGLGGVGDFSDDNAHLVDPDALDAAALMGDDDISLWETEGGGYTDGWEEVTPSGAIKKGSVANGHRHSNGSINGIKK